jgi:hypothetical protein
VSIGQKYHFFRIFYKKIHKKKVLEKRRVLGKTSTLVLDRPVLEHRTSINSYFKSWEAGPGRIVKSGNRIKEKEEREICLDNIAYDDVNLHCYFTLS